MNGTTVRLGGGHLVALLAFLALPPLAAAPPELTPEQRLGRLERILENQSLSGLLQRIEGLQQEVQRLRGELEMQTHAIDALTRRQRALYLDLDQRFTALTGQEQPAADADAPPPSRQPAGAQAPPPRSPTGEPASGVAPGDPAREKPAYQQAFDLLKQGSYPESIAAFRRFLAAYPNGAYTDNARYWLGEASYVTRDFDTAMADFAQVLERHPDSTKVPGALLKMGFIRYEQGRWAEARKLLTDLRTRFPRSTEARLAGQRLERMRQEGR